MAERSLVDRWSGSHRRSVGAILLVVITTFGLPVLLGQSWWFPPTTIFRPPGPTHRYLPALDMYTFSQVDWPLREIAARELRSGVLPLWNPFSSLGVPLAGQYETQLLLPFEWIELLGGPGLWNWLLLVKLALAGAGCYLFLNTALKNTPGALVGSLAYLFSSYLLWFYPIGGFLTGAVLVPWLFWAVQRFADASTRVTRSVGILGLVVGLVLLAGQPQVGALSLLGAALYGCVLLPRIVGRGWRAARPVFAAIGGCLGIGVAAAMLAIFRDSLTAGYSFHPPGAYAGAATASLNFTTPVWPFLMGQLMWQWHTELPYDRFSNEAFALALGPFGLLLGCVAVASIPSLRRAGGGVAWHVGALAGLALVILSIMMLGSAGFRWVWDLPLLNQINFPRYVPPVLSFALAGLAGWAVAALPSLSPRRLLLANALALGIAGGTLWMLWPYLLAPPAATDPWYYRASLLLGAGSFGLLFLASNVVLWLACRQIVRPGRAQLALAVCMFAQGAFYVRYGFDLGDEIRRLGILAVELLAAVLLALGYWRVAAVGLVASVGATGVLLAVAPQRLTDVWTPYTQPPAHIERLRSLVGEGSGGGRVLGTAGLVVPNLTGSYGVAELPSASPIQADGTARFVLKVLSPRQLGSFVPIQWPGVDVNGSVPSWDDFRQRRPYYNLINVRYLVDYPNGELTKNPIDGLHQVYADDRIAVYEDERAFNRAFAVTTVAAVKTADEAERALLAPGFDPRRVAIVEDPAGTFPTALGDQPGAQQRTVRLERYSPDRVELAIDEGPLSLVILSDAAFPGWSVTVDGLPREIYRTDVTLRGVLVEPGPHRVVFAFMPPGLPIGALVSIISVIICGVLCAPVRLRRPSAQVAALAQHRESTYHPGPPR